MSHRFPMQEKVFPPLQMSESMKNKFTHTASVQLTRALRDYDKYRKWQASQPPNLRYQLHPALWKPVKTCEQLTVYRRVPADDTVVTASSNGPRRRARSRTLDAKRLTTATTDTDSVSSAPKESVIDTSWPNPTRVPGPTASSDWTMPTLLQVGTIEGTLDDVMYGLTSFNAVETLIKSSYMTEEVVDAEILHEFQGPTPREPFRFFGLKWVVKSTPSSTVKAFVWPRDLTFLAATGILYRQGGERVGYHLMHSVDLGKGYGPLTGKRIVRGRVSSCYFYRQTSATAVDVYMKAKFEPNGSVHESVALLSTADSLTYCAKSALCAQNKKLSWLLNHPKTNETKAGSARPNFIRMKKRNDCGVCTRPIGTFSRGYSCRVCSSRACSTCFVKKKLSFSGQGYKTVEQRSVGICTHCLTHARKLASIEIAKQEVAERERLNRRRGTRQGARVSARSLRNRSNSHPDVHKLRRGTVSRWEDNKEERTEAKRTFLTVPAQRINSSAHQTDSPKKKAEPARDYNSETEYYDMDDNTVENFDHILLPLDSRSRTKTQCDSRKATATAMATLLASPVATPQGVWNDDFDDDGSVVSLSLSSEVPMLTDPLPEAKVQYAWGAVVQSPTSQKFVAPSAAWPSPPPSPLSSPLPPVVPLPAQDEQATAWTSVPRPTIPRIQAGASTQEVLAQFEELCNAAENVYRTARKHTITHLEPNTNRFDMSAVD